MEYTRAVELAPPGWRHFTMQDFERLPASVRRHEMERVPKQEQRLIARRDSDAMERLVRGMFWTLVYHLEPERWDELARYEPIHPDVLEALPDRVEVSVDVGAGSGRLTTHLAKRSGRVVAIEPSNGLRSILTRRAPSVWVVAGWAEHLPLPSHRAQLTVACGAFGPEPRVLAEMHRVTAPGGCVALISPENPEWFDANCWSHVTTSRLPIPPHPRWLEEFFGELDPPRELVMLRVR